MTPTISVIIPAYRWDNFVVEAIQSVQQQTFSPNEIIVVNDGAGELINGPVRAQFPTVKIVELEKNSGDAAARNAGSHAAQSEWLAYLDADDLWLPDKLAKQLAALTEHPRWDGCYTGVTMFNQQGDIASYCHKPSPLTINDLLICTHAFLQCVLLRKKDFLAIGGFDSGYRNASDHDFLIRYALSGRLLGFVSEPLLRLRRMEHGNISGNWWRVFKGKTRLFWRNRQAFFKYGGWRAPLRFFGHVLGECAAKTPLDWQRHALWFFAKCLLWCAGVDWQQQLREQENLSTRSKQ
jgi:teichuronic acid biosynthesis glycosyltransferase TuaG